jgi:protein-S-isoprenylcysteine O-methyltransferase Ste14
MHVVDSVIAIGWVVFWLGWLAAASGVKTGRSRLGRFAVIRVVLVLVIIGLGRIGAFRHSAVHDPVPQGIGLLLFAAGLSLAVWARVHLGRNWGTPMSEKDDPDLITSGPYRWIRNPIYSGLILAMVGTSTAVNVEWLVVTAVVGGYFIYSAVMEQRYMTARFPATYPAYRDSTKMLIPYVF